MVNASGWLNVLHRHSRQDFDNRYGPLHICCCQESFLGLNSHLDLIIWTENDPQIPVALQNGAKGQSPKVFTSSRSGNGGS
jgi:hypothetical protein